MLNFTPNGLVILLTFFNALFELYYFDIINVVFEENIKVESSNILKRYKMKKCYFRCFKH